MLQYFDEEMRTTPKIHVKIHVLAIPYVRTELQLRFAWCLIGLTRGEYDSEERKRSKGEKMFLMKSVRDLMTQEGAAVACAKQRDTLCFIHKIRRHKIRDTQNKEVRKQVAEAH